MPVWLILLGGGALIALLAKQASTVSPFAIGQTVYSIASTPMQVSGTAIPLQAGTRLYVQTSDTSGVTEVRTDSGNVGTVSTAALSAMLPAGTSMQVN